MSWTKKVKIISISFALLLALFFAFILIHGASGTSSAPFIGMNGKSLANNAPDTSVSIPDLSASTGIAAISGSVNSPAGESGSQESNNYITFQMDASDIHRGNLILVNTTNKYEIPDEHVFVDIAGQKTASYRVSDNSMLLSGSVIGPLNNMMDAFNNDTKRDTVTIISAYRDYDRQYEIYNEYTYLVGQNDAGKWAALPGYSEHHTGMAVDFGIFRDDVVRTFFGTDIYEWFSLNCDQYGFILRYPENKAEITKTEYEPWHFRYVGVPHASFIRESGLCLEEYIEFIMGFTRDEPYKGTLNGETYEVYYTQDYEIPVPVGCKIDISGNNKDGFIVTIRTQRGLRPQPSNDGRDTTQPSG